MGRDMMSQSRHHHIEQPLTFDAIPSPRPRHIAATHAGLETGTIWIGVHNPGHTYIRSGDEGQNYSAAEDRLIKYVAPARKSGNTGSLSESDPRDLPIALNETENRDFEVPVGVGYFAPRKGRYRAGFVEELEKTEVRRSNALREKPSATELRKKYDFTGNEIPQSATRPFSWVSPDDEPVASFEQIEEQEQRDQQQVSQKKHAQGTRPSSIVPGQRRVQTMRKATLARLEGYR